MRSAQRLYENGYITYLRTDSTTLSESAIDAARAQARELYGDAYVPAQPRQYTRKVKNAQEAHEAIRPAGERFRTPGEMAHEVDGDDFRLYELIWQRTVASQMADARGTTVSVRIAGTAATGEAVTFAASGRTITFPGFLKAYVETLDEGSDGEADDAESRLPELTQGQALTADSLTPEGHTTNPPARYTEPSLVKSLEDLGIGRPSTYASIIKTIQDRGYVWKKGAALVPSWIAFAVVGLLEHHFGRLVDYDFTAAMEDELDAIASGNQHRTDWLSAFYFGGRAGPRGLGGALGRAEEARRRQPRGDRRPRDQLHPDVRRRGGAGRALRAVPGAGARRRVAAREPARRPAARRADPRGGRAAVRVPVDGRTLGADPVTGHEIVAKEGRYGPYVTEILPEDASAKKVEAAHRVAVQGHVDRDRHAGGRAAAAVAAAAGGHRPGERRGDHRAERPLRAVPEEGHGLAVARERGAAVHRHPRRGAGDLQGAQAAGHGAPPRPRRRCASWARTRPRRSRW